MFGKKSEPTPACVLDSSVTVAWFFEDEASAYAQAVEDALVQTAAVVPVLWHLEVVNALLVGERRSRTTAAKVTQFLMLVSALPVTMDDQTSARSWDDTLALARLHNLSAYDAAYLELAQRRSLPLATLDKHLRSVAKAAGIQLYRP